MRPPPKLLPDRSVNPEWLAAVTGDVLSQWVCDLLHEQDLDLPPWVNDTPHRVLIAAYKAAPEGVRKVLRDAVADYVLQMADGEDRTWGGLPGDRLVFVAGEICGRTIAATLTRMVSSGHYVDLTAPIPGDVHGRMLQALVRLDVRESIDFWLGQARLCPVRYLPVAMRGLEISGLNPFHLLGLVDTTWNDELLADIEMVVDLLDMAHGPEWVAQRIAECRERIPAEVLRVLPKAPTCTDPRQALIGAADHLPDREQCVVGLWYHDELPPRKIAQTLGISEALVLETHARALEMLRTMLGPALVADLARPQASQRSGSGG